MSTVKIRVTAYSGHREEESPLVFFIDDERIEVVEIIEMWLEEDFESRTRKRFFKLKGNDNYIHKIFYDEKTMEWFLGR